MNLIGEHSGPGHVTNLPTSTTQIIQNQINKPSPKIGDLVNVMHDQVEHHEAEHLDHGTPHEFRFGIWPIVHLKSIQK